MKLPLLLVKAQTLSQPRYSEEFRCWAHTIYVQIAPTSQSNVYNNTSVLLSVCTELRARRRTITHERPLLDPKWVCRQAIMNGNPPSVSRLFILYSERSHNSNTHECTLIVLVFMLLMLALLSRHLPLPLPNNPPNICRLTQIIYSSSDAMLDILLDMLFHKSSKSANHIPSCPTHRYCTGTQRGKESGAGGKTHKS